MGRVGTKVMRVLIMAIVFASAGAFAPNPRSCPHPHYCIGGIQPTTSSQKVSISMSSSASNENFQSAALFTVASTSAVALAKEPASRSVLMKAFGSCFLTTTSLQLFPAYVTLTYGYGLIMTMHAVKMRRLFASALSGGAPILLFTAVLSYGLKVCVLQAARDTTPAYRQRVLPNFAVLEKTDTKCPFTKTLHKIPLNLGVSGLLSFYALPLLAVATGPAFFSAQPSAWRTSSIAYGTGLAWLGLIVQSIADLQKFRAKARLGANEPILGTGLWRFSRHPNYVGEVMFHSGIGMAAVASCSSVASAFLSLLSPAALVSLSLLATNSLDKRQESEYKNRPGYLEYVEKTPKLVL